MKFFAILPLTVALAAAVLCVAGCSSTEPSLPPLRIAVPAKSPAEVQQALAGVWVIDVETSAEVLAREQYKPRKATLLHRDIIGAPTLEDSTVSERFDASAYREARCYWSRLLDKPDMEWRLTFNPDGTGVHRAIVRTGGAPQNTLFSWRLDGWRLRLDYPAGSDFRSFDVEMPSAMEWNYPMQPLGDHFVMRRENR
jgi:hypothetical protein